MNNNKIFDNEAPLIAMAIHSCPCDGCAVVRKLIQHEHTICNVCCANGDPCSMHNHAAQCAISEATRLCIKHQHNGLTRWHGEAMSVVLVLSCHRSLIADNHACVSRLCNELFRDDDAIIQTFSSGSPVVLRSIGVVMQEIGQVQLAAQSVTWFCRTHTRSDDRARAIMFVMGRFDALTKEQQCIEDTLEESIPILATVGLCSKENDNDNDNDNDGIDWAWIQTEVLLIIKTILGQCCQLRSISALSTIVTLLSWMCDRVAWGIIDDGSNECVKYACYFFAQIIVSTTLLPRAILNAISNTVIRGAECLRACEPNGPRCKTVASLTVILSATISRLLHDTPPCLTIVEGEKWWWWCADICNRITCDTWMVRASLCHHKTAMLACSIGNNVPMLAVRNLGASSSTTTTTALQYQNTKLRTGFQDYFNDERMWLLARCQCESDTAAVLQQKSKSYTVMAEIDMLVDLAGWCLGVRHTYDDGGTAWWQTTDTESNNVMHIVRTAARTMAMHGDAKQFFDRTGMPGAIITLSDPTITKNDTDVDLLKFITDLICVIAEAAPIEMIATALCLPVSMLTLCHDEGVVVTKDDIETPPQSFIKTAGMAIASVFTYMGSAMTTTNHTVPLSQTDITINNNNNNNIEEEEEDDDDNHSSGVTIDIEAQRYQKIQHQHDIKKITTIKTALRHHCGVPLPCEQYTSNTIDAHCTVDDIQMLVRVSTIGQIHVPISCSKMTMDTDAMIVLIALMCAISKELKTEQQQQQEEEEEEKEEEKNVTSGQHLASTLLTYIEQLDNKFATRCLSLFLAERYPIILSKPHHELWRLSDAERFSPPMYHTEAARWIIECLLSMTTRTNNANADVMELMCVACYSCISRSVVAAVLHHVLQQHQISATVTSATHCIAVASRCAVLELSRGHTCINLWKIILANNRLMVSSTSSAHTAALMQLHRAVYKQIRVRLAGLWYPPTQQQTKSSIISDVIQCIHELCKVCAASITPDIALWCASDVLFTLHEYTDARRDTMVTVAQDMQLFTDLTIRILVHAEENCATQTNKDDTRVSSLLHCMRDMSNDIFQTVAV